MAVKSLVAHDQAIPRNRLALARLRLGIGGGLCRLRNWRGERGDDAAAKAVIFMMPRISSPARRQR